MSERRDLSLCKIYGRPSVLCTETGCHCKNTGTPASVAELKKTQLCPPDVATRLTPGFNSRAKHGFFERGFQDALSCSYKV